MVVDLAAVTWMNDFNKEVQWNSIFHKPVCTICHDPKCCFSRTSNPGAFCLLLEIFAVSSSLFLVMVVCVGSMEYLKTVSLTLLIDINWLSVPCGTQADKKQGKTILFAM